MRKTDKQILISAGETSGDIHAANLIYKVKTLDPTIKFYGMGLENMKRAGVKLIIDANDLSLIGGLAIITKFYKILRAYLIMKRFIQQQKPDLLILVDYPGFNLRLAKIAKKAGTKVLYYISPKVWAWHQSRVKIIKKHVDLMAVIFPFEIDFYKKHGIDAKFVGNPLLELIEKKLPLKEAQKLFNIDPEQKTIGLFPGSRSSEVKSLLPIMLEAVKIIQKHNPNTKFLLSQASSINDEELKSYLQATDLPIKIIKEHNYDIMQVCDAIITASGTATLEMALIETPLVIIYKLSWLEYQIAKHLVKIPYVGLCNILAQKKIAQELLQYEAAPQKIAIEIKKILNNQTYRQTMIENLQNIKKTLKGSEKKDLAKLIIKLIA